MLKKNKQTNGVGKLYSDYEKYCVVLVNKISRYDSDLKGRIAYFDRRMSIFTLRLLHEK